MVWQAETSWTTTCLSSAAEIDSGDQTMWGMVAKTQPLYPSRRKSVDPAVWAGSALFTFSVLATCSQAELLRDMKPRAGGNMRSHMVGTVMMLMMQPSGPSTNILAGGRRRVSSSSESLGSTWLVTNHLLVYWMLLDACLKSIQKSSDVNWQKNSSDEELMDKAMPHLSLAAPRAALTTSRKMTPQKTQTQLKVSKIRLW